MNDQEWQDRIEEIRHTSGFDGRRQRWRTLGEALSQPAPPPTTVTRRHHVRGRLAAGMPAPLEPPKPLVCRSCGLEWLSDDCCSMLGIAVSPPPPTLDPSAASATAHRRQALRDLGWQPGPSFEALVTGRGAG